MGFALTTMSLTSSAFANGLQIPKEHTGEGPDTSPSLAWNDVPEGSKSFAIVCHDPDAPLLTPEAYGYVHWVLYGIPGSVRNLPENSSDYTQGRNDFGNLGYGGPMPPPGHGVHQYYFWVFALNEELDLPEGLTMLELFKAIEPAVIGMNRLVGTYERN